MAGRGQERDQALIEREKNPATGATGFARWAPNYTTP